MKKVKNESRVIAFLPVIFVIAVILLISFVVLWQNIFVANSVSDKESPEQIVLQAFSTSGAKPVRFSLNSWGIINGAMVDNRGIGVVLKLAAAQFGADNIRNSDIKIHQTDSGIRAELGIQPDDNRSISFIIDKNNDMNTYLVVDIVQDMNPDTDVLSEQDNILLENDIWARSRIYDTYTLLGAATDGKNRINKKPRINSSVVGYFDEKLTNDQINTVGARVLEKTEAKKVGGLFDKKLVSVTAYSPRISEWINEDSKKVNLNVALRYNSFEGKTYIWIATPLITVEY